MHICRRVIFLILTLTVIIKARAQPQHKIDSLPGDSAVPADTADPKREFRGVWIATVENIDWPSHPGLPTEQQKRELTDRLNAHQQEGINAVMFQIRPAADAFYAKSREPWSKWLTGKQGKAPDP